MEPSSLVLRVRANITGNNLAQVTKKYFDV
jgi:hypothetical protein